ncbi:MAG TPA: class I tRNA ligase family protein, partial [Candidatus Paceibacterota bacterium]|nr:class I tRNA ligase family protein [Candidatus Paceibacterota bacterium]
LVVGNTPGTDTKLDENRIKGYKNFANKLWNITRFILENTADADRSAPRTDTDQALRAELDGIIADLTKDMDEFRIYLGAEKIYHYAWDRLAAEILEDSKKIFASDDDAAKASRKATLHSLLRDVLKVIHPFMPFVTEEIWQSLPDSQGMLMVSPWPAS